MDRRFCEKTLSRFLVLIALAIGSSSISLAQSKPEFPKTIRGYKVHKAKVAIQNDKDRPISDVEKNVDSSVKIGSPKNLKLSLSGAAFEIPVSMTIHKTTGRVDSIVFEDMRVNGIKMQVEEVTQPFDFLKGVDTELPTPLKVKIDIGSNPKDLLNFTPTLGEFEITGRVYVFGSFKKFGMKFKRVIPSDFKYRTKLSLASLIAAN